MSKLEWEVVAWISSALVIISLISAIGLYHVKELEAEIKIAQAGLEQCSYKASTQSGSVYFELAWKKNCNSELE